MGNTDNGQTPSKCCLTSPFLHSKIVQHGNEGKCGQQHCHHPYQLMEADRVVTGKKRAKLLSPSPQLDVQYALPDPSMVAASTKCAFIPVNGGGPSLVSLSRAITASAYKDDVVQHLIEALSTSSWSSSEEHEESLLNNDACN
ncbi:hypothetical protein TraAM80_08597 [Trypanosoma rangeli]|uniref:Uncharacterized protein n=1 Tax=Trypanosoma rangeli TaxID=5698 RepID=A0A422MZS9_TRYRA|nr:uncharacterized protein TraAM80_08597 [Trypanosoma rangeli]RNE98745.1 hypothetical protein TraAM80_08597 [Trypanosoma rangeli]|eukprot:RNE98745.1 hypothetical protein TraAM80_08597 [Trypanosoma rangeli]